MSFDSPIRIVIADDFPVFRRGIAQCIDMIKPNIIQIVGEADNGETLVQEVKRHKPDIVLTDIRMPEMNGIEASRIIKQQFPKISVIALTMAAEPHIIYEMFEAGAKGYVFKNANLSEIELAIETVYSGDSYYCNRSSKALIKMIGTSKHNPFNKNYNSLLTPKEIEVIRLICLQLTNKEIASRMNVSTRTVEEYSHHIKEKIGAKNLVGIALYGIRNNLVDAE